MSSDTQRVSWSRICAIVIVLIVPWLPFDTRALSEPKTSLQPSGEGLPFDARRFQDFGDYVRHTQDRLKRHKVYVDPHRKEMELAAALPFEQAPTDDACQPAEDGRYRRGILLLHGLADVPFAMRDLADAFAKRCFLVRVLLLPGHGTRSGDLLNISREDWLAATRFGLQTLKEDADAVFVGGFSLGGLLSTHALLNDASIDGAFLFSPALAIGDARIIGQTVWLRHILQWLDRDGSDDYARYEAMPLNATAETFLLTRDLERALDQRHLVAPVFIALSLDDAVIDPVAARQYFEDRFAHPGGRLLVYRRNPQEGIDSGDGRIRYINSFLPDQRIAGFSHLAVHIAPDNEHYGENGDYRSCGQNSDESAAVVARCLAASNPWRGEAFGESLAAIAKDAPRARLTYNPRFGELLDLIDEFIAANAF